MEDSIHHKISLSTELFDIPAQSLLFRHIAYGTMGSSKLWLFCIIGHWYKYLEYLISIKYFNIIGCTFGFEIAFSFHEKLYFSI